MQFFVSCATLTKLASTFDTTYVMKRETDRKECKHGKQLSSKLVTRIEYNIDQGLVLLRVAIDLNLSQVQSPISNVQSYD